MAPPPSTEVVGSDNFGQRVKYGILLLTAYYVVGCNAFFLVERDAELDRYNQNQSMYKQMQKLYSFKYCEEDAFKSLSFCESQHKFDEALEDYFNARGPNSLEDKGNWSWLGTIFFLTSLSTTIGYGHSHPITSGGQILCVVFALIGLPIMAYTLAIAAEVWFRIGNRVLMAITGDQINTKTKRVIFLSFVLCLFLFGGAFCFSRLEDWSYLESVYFCFVTLSTVGFGDYLPASSASRLFCILYMISGLGVCASLIATLTGFVSETQNMLDILLKEPFERLGEECCCCPREKDEKASFNPRGRLYEYT